MLSFSHLLLVLIIIVILFGAGKLPKVMGDIGKGIRNLRDELGGDDKEKASKQEILPPEDKK
jgi:sec-independent protein translocase protein TatA